MTSMFSKPKTPQVKDPAPLPDEGDPNIMAAERRKRASALTRGGRSSTIMSDAMGEDYTKAKMGS